MLSDSELTAMKNASVRCFKKLCHNIVEVTDYKVVIHEDEKFSCILEAIVGSLRKRKRYSYDLLPSTKSKNVKLVENLKIEDI